MLGAVVLVGFRVGAALIVIPLGYGVCGTMGIKVGGAVVGCLVVGETWSA
jgi:hypothetical protein